MTLSKSIHVAENGIISFFFVISLELPWWLSGKESACKCRRPRFDPWAGKIPWRRDWLPTPVFLPGETHGQRSLAGYIQFTGLQRVGCDWVTNTFPLLPTALPPQLLIESLSRALFLEVLASPSDDNDGPLPVSIDVIHLPLNSKLPHHFYIFISRHCRFLGTTCCKSSFNQIPLNQFTRLKVRPT